MASCEVGEVQQTTRFCSLMGVPERTGTSASSYCFRLDGPVCPATSPALPASKNRLFQFPTDCSDTFARRAASVTVISPARIDSTIADRLLGGEHRRPRHDDQTQTSGSRFGASVKC